MDQRARAGQGGRRVSRARADVAEREAVARLRFDHVLESASAQEGSAVTWHDQARRRPSKLSDGTSR